MSQYIYTFILRMRNRHLFAIDLLVICVTPAFSLILRFEDFQVFSKYLQPLMVFTIISIVWKLIIFHSLGLYNRYWRMADVSDIASLTFITVLVWIVDIIVCLGILIPVKVFSNDFPRSIPVIDGGLTLLCIGGVRLGLRLAFEFNERAGKLQNQTKKTRVLVVGAGVAGSSIITEMHSNPSLARMPVCLADDDEGKRKLSLHGVPVLGSLRDIPKIIITQTIDEVIIAMPNAPGEVIRSIVKVCAKLGIKSKTVPGIFEILAGSALTQLRDIHIEDLLRRGTVETDTTKVEALIRGTTVMVTGAGGSIGAELCRQICKFNPGKLILLGHGENSIFEIAKELRRVYCTDGNTMRMMTIIADIRDSERMEMIFQNLHPCLVFHAAAHKHVGLMEGNIPDAVTNNVLGTKTLVHLAGKYDVKRFVMISSDKAVYPTTIMGVTKRIAEMIVHEAAEQYGKPFVTVRFGNVLGSRGSVVPIFMEQIARGEPLTITHPEAERFFMTIPEAVQLVLQAATMGRGGEVFVLDMGKPIKILDLAIDLIRLSGLRENVDVEIKYNGFVPGEKIKEKLFYDFENIEKSEHGKIFVHRNGSSKKLHSQNFYFFRNDPTLARVGC